MTTHPTLDAATALCEVLEQENAALAAMDIVKANGFLEAKTTATDHLMKARRQMAAPQSAEAEALVLRLKTLAQDNKALLERAMIAQNRVMACIARAAPKVIQQAAQYGANGTRPVTRLMPPVAFSARV